uniref:(northern house mosquito) hypothetical protein n=1 Tax=Culex pipiens TaxID=7175 RepID=A0A8D8HE86_CULPI
MSKRIRSEHTRTGSKVRIYLPVHQLLLQTFLPVEPAKAHQVRHKAGAIEARSGRVARIAIARELALQPRRHVHRGSVLHRCDRRGAGALVRARPKALLPGARWATGGAVLQLRVATGARSLDLQPAEVDRAERGEHEADGQLAEDVDLRGESAAAEEEVLLRDQPGQDAVRADVGKAAVGAAVLGRVL